MFEINLKNSTSAQIEQLHSQYKEEQNRHQRELERWDMVLIKYQQADVLLNDFVNNAPDTHIRLGDLLNSFVHDEVYLCESLEYKKELQDKLVFWQQKGVPISTDLIGLIKKEINELKENATLIKQQREQIAKGFVVKKENYRQKEKLLSAKAALITSANQETLTGLAQKNDLTAIKKLIGDKWWFQKKDFINAKNYDGYNALHYLCEHGNVEAVAFLLNEGANVNLPNRAGYYPIHLATKRSSLEQAKLIKLLKDKGANLNQEGPDKQRPLHSAAYFGNTYAGKTLIELGADINAQESTESTGKTPLHTASYKGHVAFITLLLSKDADVMVLNANNERAIYEAAAYGQRNEDVIDAFNDFGVCFTSEEEVKLKEISKRGSPKLPAAHLFAVKNKVIIPSEHPLVDESNFGFK